MVVAPDGSAQGVSADRLVTDAIMRMNRPEEREEAGIVPETEGRPIEAFPLDGSDPEVFYTAWEPGWYRPALQRNSAGWPPVCRKVA